MKLKQISGVAKMNTIYISRKVYIKKGKRVYIYVCVCVYIYNDYAFMNTIMHLYMV